MSPIGLNSLETIRMKVSCSNCYNFKNPSVLAQTIRSSHNSAYFKNVFLDNFDSCLEYKSVSYTMVYTPCFKEVYHNIGNQSSCLCVTSFLKAGLYYIIQLNGVTSSPNSLGMGKGVTKVSKVHGVAVLSVVVPPINSEEFVKHAHKSLTSAIISLKLQKSETAKVVCKALHNEAPDYKRAIS